MSEEKSTSTQEPSPELIAQFLKALTERANQPKEIDAVYANSTNFEVSAWDLKIFFGQLNQRPPKNEIDWHSAMTLPWMHAKIFEYYLRLNLLFYEKKFGRINLPPQAIPAPPAQPTEELMKSDPQAAELWEAYKKAHEETFGT